MSELKIVGVMRAGAFSPNHVGNDAAIFNEVTEHLRKCGYAIEVMGEEDFLKRDVRADVIIDMAREAASIAKLQEMEQQGTLVINSGFGISNCTRERMTRLLVGHGIPYPQSVIVDTNHNIVGELEKAGIEECWVKRGESHSLHKEDVSYCRHPQEAQEILHEYFYRGIKRAVINRHLKGDLIKFYGVRGRNFFYWFYPFFGHKEKYGMDKINGEPAKYSFDVDTLIDDCEKACEVMDVEIYGGDCIVDAEGRFQIIDFNDWPSFAPCRKEGAKAIAGYLLKRLRAFEKGRQ